MISFFRLPFIVVVACLATVASRAATFTVTSTNDAGPGTLRQAMLDANLTATADTIAFNIPGPGEKHIYLLSALPIITNALTIDGFTQSGSKSNTLASGNNSVLLINVYRTSQGLGGFHVRTNRVTLRGLSLRNSAQVAAVHFQNCASNIVEGCLIGTDAAGLLDWGNGYMGVRISNSSFNRVGGTNAWQHNIIAFCNGAVGVFSGTNNAILGNSIFAIDSIGIDLDYNIRTPNDPDDSDTGANERQNFPVITNASLVANGVLIQGELQTLPNRSYRLEFFSGPVNFLPDYGYAKDFIGWTNVSTDSSGFANFGATLPVPVPAGYFICATATDTNGNTSEFSAGEQIPNAQYVAKPIGSLGHGFTQGNDLNNLGDVVGFAYAGAAGTNSHAFLYTNAVMTDLGTLGGFHSFARAINDSRVVVGYAELSSRALHAFRWTDGVMQDLGLLPGGGTNSWAFDINNAGQIVGAAEVTDFRGNTHAVLWQNGTITDLGTLPGDGGSEAWGIAENGDVFGASWQTFAFGSRGPYKAFLRRNGVMTELAALSPLYSWPGRLNIHGDIATSVKQPDGAPHGFVRLGNTVHDFGLFGVLFGQGNDVNDAGDAVGFASTPMLPLEAGGTRAVLYRRGTIYDLNALLMTPLSPALRTATAINESGVILANNVGQVLESVLIGGNSPNATNVFLLYPLRLSAEAAGGKVILSWPTGMTGFTVQTKTNLGSPGNWIDAASAPTLVGDRYYITNNLGDGQRFFRLCKP